MTITLLDGSCVLGPAAIGGKAWSLNRMAGLTLPVPPAFCFPTGLSLSTIATGALPSSARGEIRSGVRWIEGQVNCGFGRTESPLLVSVRSGAQQSMPGMMDTLLNVGITGMTAPSLQLLFGAEWTREARYRLAQQLGCQVAPDDPFEQLELAIAQVCFSWMSERAISYRRHHNLPDGQGGTAVTIQAMVFGNRDHRSGTGVLFSRNPQTGDNAPFGEWLPGAQGEDLVGGGRDPLSIADFKHSLPDVHAELMCAAAMLERAAGDVQDIEFTVDGGKLWLLQTRNAKRTAKAELHLAVALSEENLITRHEALLRISSDSVTQVLTQRHSADRYAEAVASGLPVCGGISSGLVVADANEVQERAADGQDVILARATTDPSDLPGILAAVAVITEQGGATSHAAVVCRELNRVCVVGCGTGSLTNIVGQTATVNGDTGEITMGLPGGSDDAPAQTDPDLEIIADWLEVDIDELANAVTNYQRSNAISKATDESGAQP